MLNIEIWSDYTCPYCYIGKVQLLQVLKEMNITDVTFTHRVFLLDAGKESHPERTFLEGLHLPSEQESVMSKKLVQIETLAEKVGLRYQLAHIPDISTENAHRLTLWAQEKGMHMALNSRIFKAYFEECQDISSHAVVAQLASEVGLPENEAREVLANTDLYMDKVFEDFEEAGELEIDLVPHFIFNDRIDISGIMTSNAIRKHIEKVL